MNHPTEAKILETIAERLFDHARDFTWSELDNRLEQIDAMHDRFIRDGRYRELGPFVNALNAAVGQPFVEITTKTVRTIGLLWTTTNTGIRFAPGVVEQLKVGQQGRPS